MDLEIRRFWDAFIHFWDAYYDFWEGINFKFFLYVYKSLSINLRCIFLILNDDKMDIKHRRSIRLPKSILLTAKVLETISNKMAVNFAIRLFMTPVRYAIPKREMEMDRNSVQKLVAVPVIGKEVVVYEYGKGDKRVLLVHGWSGRGTQLVAIANRLLELGYSTVSYDAPSHGKSDGKTSNLKEFIACNLELEKIYGPFDYAIGHSLGGMSILNAVKQGMLLKRAIIIGSGDMVGDIIGDFISILKLKASIGNQMRVKLERRFEESMDSLSAYVAARDVSIPVLVMHDEDDEDVPVRAAYHIDKNLKCSELVITKGLGHRKILGDSGIIKRIVAFIDY